MTARRKYWLMKSEPGTYSITDLAREGHTHWEGVRNYQARNMMRDEMNVGDLVLFYHSSAAPPGVAGVARVCSEAYPDHFAQDPTSPYYDKKATKDNPIWMMVDVEFVEQFPAVLPMDALRRSKPLADMLVIRKGMRLSVQPVTAPEYREVLRMARK